ncbi:MAG: peptidase M42, partial [Arcobacter sp.]
NAYFRSPLKAKIKKIAIKKRIKYHYKDAYIKNMMKQQNKKMSLGVTELGRIIFASKGEIQGTSLQIPTIGYHTSQETATKKSVQAMIDILQEIYLIKKV